MAKTTIFSAVILTLLSCSVVWAEQSVESEVGGAGLFSGTLGDSIWSIAAFVLLLVVLGKFAWKPLLNGLNSRQNHIEQQLKSAEDSRVKAEHLLDEYKQQGLTVVREATEQAQRYHQQMAEKTREESQAIRRRTHEEVESARTTAIEDLWKQTSDIVLRVSSEVLGRTMTEADTQRLIDEAVTRVRQNGGLP